jgi:hypothetical protein
MPSHGSIYDLDQAGLTPPTRVIVFGECMITTSKAIMKITINLILKASKAAAGKKLACETTKRRPIICLSTGPRLSDGVAKHLSTSRPFVVSLNHAEITCPLFVSSYSSSVSILSLLSLLVGEL